MFLKVAIYSADVSYLHETQCMWMVHNIHRFVTIYVLSQTLTTRHQWSYTLYSNKQFVSLLDSTLLSPGLWA